MENPTTVRSAIKVLLLADVGYHPGFTLPYTAPEVFKRDVDYGPATDVFSLGQVMYELLFGGLPHDLNKEGLSKLRSHYMNGDGALLELIVPERACEVGHAEILELLQLLALKCIHAQPERRAWIDWNVIVLRKVFGVMDQAC